MFHKFITTADIFVKAYICFRYSRSVKVTRRTLQCINGTNGIHLYVTYTSVITNLIFTLRRYRLKNCTFNKYPMSPRLVVKIISNNVFFAKLLIGTKVQHKVLSVVRTNDSGYELFHKIRHKILISLMITLMLLTYGLVDRKNMNVLLRCTRAIKIKYDLK
jgi:Na+-transporting NADH:ubiquinone oxidoreductase subunit NqrB